MNKRLFEKTSQHDDRIPLDNFGKRVCRGAGRLAHESLSGAAYGVYHIGEV
jgi:hypothetical protein